MPTLHEERGYAFRFRSSDGPEPPHVHVEGHGGAAKFWLEDLAIASHRGYTRRQLDQIMQIVQAHQAEFVSRWHEYFG